METPLWCGHDPGPGELVLRVEGRIGPFRGRFVSDFVICRECWRPGGQSYRLGDNHADPVVMGLYGGTAPTEPTPCAGCSRTVIRGRHPRMKYVTCSKACTVRASKARTSDVSSAVTACEGCGTELTGRTDRRFCSSACRQRAYRRRASGVSEAVTVEEVRALGEALDALGTFMDAHPVR
ncbi:hypothetical protein [Haloactinopolyspora alba]|uniref:hypothetical protein n=1 Tax=Haloactinopolyspora alba TaxID=648780 RepID=UPI000D0D80BF|nr:hypothetical protein [Haloactinopolyspora alba]